MNSGNSDSDGVAVRCSGLLKRYGELVAVDHIDLDVRRGECFGLLGPNGAGKTTTMEILEGLTSADGGRAEVLGHVWGDGADREIREHIGVQLQDTKLAERLTVSEVLRLFLSFYRRGRSLEDVLEEVELGAKRDAQVGKLSGGQRQRLAVATALIGEPDLLFLDEPTTGLDPQARRKLWDVIEAFRARGGTILLTTHYMEEAARLCDRLAILDRGKVIARGTPRELVASLGADQIVELEVADGVALDFLGALPGVAGLARAAERQRVSVKELHRALPAILAELERRAIEVRALTTHAATLDDVFLRIAGRSLEDA